ncbi:MAG: hypothetical protein ACN0LA_13705 [Candidatus Longimicrobiales bacterium M2_2A_002]
MRGAPGADLGRRVRRPNAHLNLRRLGAIVREYRRDVYGRSSSPLHAGEAGAAPERAREWRATVRAAFEAALGEGYTAVDADREAGPEGVVYYALARGFSL